MINKFFRLVFDKILNFAKNFGYKAPTSPLAPIKPVITKSEEEFIILEVPYAEKDQAKALGAKWNPHIKKWFITSKEDQSKFTKWLSKQSKSESDELRLNMSLTLKQEIYLLRSWEKCYKCGNTADVFCLAADGLIDHETDSDFKQFFTFHYLTSVSQKIKNLFKKHSPTYYFDYSKQTESSYFMNHCKCGAKLGDFFLHQEPGGAFFPMSLEEARNNVTMHQIQTSEPVRINSTYGVSDTDFVPTGAERGSAINLDS